MLWDSTVGKPTYLGLSSLASRATRTFKAWCLTTNRPVFFKDTWRILSPSLRPEHEIYKKLADAKVQHIATVLDYSDIGDQRTVTGNYAHKPWVCKTNLKPFRTLQHYRLVLLEIGCNLTYEFKDFREILGAMRNALQGKGILINQTIFLLKYFAAHRESYYKGHVLHRDISAGNIVIYNNGGLLVDWDMCKDLDLKSDEKNIFRTVGYTSRIIHSCSHHLIRYFRVPGPFNHFVFPNGRREMSLRLFKVVSMI